MVASERQRRAFRRRRCAIILCAEHYRQMLFSLACGVLRHMPRSIAVMARSPWHNGDIFIFMGGRLAIYQHHAGRRYNRLAEIERAIWLPTRCLKL